MSAPVHAAQIWSHNQQFVLQFPPLATGEATSTISFPMTERGIATLFRVLQERAKAADLRIGFKGTPCKREVEDAIHSQVKYAAWIKALTDAATMSSATKAAAAADLEALGL